MRGLVVSDGAVVAHESKPRPPVAVFTSSGELSGGEPGLVSSPRSSSSGRAAAGSGTLAGVTGVTSELLREVLLGPLRLGPLGLGPLRPGPPRGAAPKLAAAPPGLEGGGSGGAAERLGR